MIREIFYGKIRSILSITLVLLLNTSNAGAVICLDLELNSAIQSKVSPSPLPVSCQPSPSNCCLELTINDPRQLDQSGESCSKCVDLSITPSELACLSEQDDQYSPALVENGLFSSNSFENVTLPERKQLYLDNPPSLKVYPPKVLRSVILII